MVRLSHSAHWIQYLISSRSQEPRLCFQFLLLMSSEWGTKWSSPVLFWAFCSIVFLSLWNTDFSGLDSKGEANERPTLPIIAASCSYLLLSPTEIIFLLSALAVFSSFMVPVIYSFILLVLCSEALKGQQASVDIDHLNIYFRVFARSCRFCSSLSYLGSLFPV